jgi:CBS domain-containing protein
MNGTRRAPIGIVTDRDIVVEVVAPELHPETITVGDIMGRRLATVGETESALAALEIMRTQGVQRLPVVRKNGSLVGIVSTHDLVLALPSELADISIIVARGRSRETRARK